MFDINTAIGHWPFRRIPNQSAAELRRHLESHGITGAAAAHTAGLFYKNCHDANLELAEAIAAHDDFFVGVATLNPCYAAWERDLEACVKGLGFRALRMVPQYHDYSLSDAPALALVRAAAALDIPVLIPGRVVDTRQRHWLDVERMQSLQDILAVCRAVPAARIVVTELPVTAGALSTPAGQPVCGNLYVETSRQVSCYGQVMAKVVRLLGADHVLFGSGAPFKEVEPSLLKVYHADLDAEARCRVCGSAARALLGLS